MPAKSGRQRRAAGMALAAKRSGKAPRKGSAAAKMAKGMSKSQLRHFARKP